MNANATTGRRWRQRAGVAAAPLGLTAALVGWALFTPLAHSGLLGGWPYTAAAAAALAAVVLATAALSPRARPGPVAAIAAVVGAAAGVAAVAGLLLTALVAINLAT